MMITEILAKQSALQTYLLTADVREWFGNRHNVGRAPHIRMHGLPNYRIGP